MRGEFEEKQFTGTWAVDDNKLCLDFPGDLDDGCSTIARYPDGRLQLFTAVGDPAGYFNVIKGNPDNF